MDIDKDEAKRQMDKDLAHALELITRAILSPIGNGLSGDKLQELMEMAGNLIIHVKMMHTLSLCEGSIESHWRRYCLDTGLNYSPLEAQLAP